MRNKSGKELRNDWFANFPVEDITSNFNRLLWQDNLLSGLIDGRTFSEELRNGMDLSSEVVLDHSWLPLRDLASKLNFSPITTSKQCEQDGLRSRFTLHRLFASLSLRNL